MEIWCVAAFVLGIVIGYVFNWAVRHNPKPDAKEIGALIAAVLIGAVVQFVQKRLGHCEAALAWYVIGVAVGFFVYLVLLRLGWEKIKSRIDQGVLRGVPIFPWRGR